MARIPYFDPASASPVEQAHARSRGSLNLFRMLPYAGMAAPAYLSLGGAILRSGELDAQLRELAIVRVGILTRATYEVHHHRRLAAMVGLSDEKIEAIEQGAESDVFSMLEKLVLRFTDELVHNVKAPDDLFQQLLEAIGRRSLVELVLTIGFYLMVSRFLENFEIEVETTLP
ncbi:MAG TPA: carboxymuconolactone decarboxylase family protein [Steroidobacteraceae bacterium]